MQEVVKRGRVWVFDETGKRVAKIPLEEYNKVDPDDQEELTLSDDDRDE